MSNYIVNWLAIAGVAIILSISVVVAVRAQTPEQCKPFLQIYATLSKKQVADFAPLLTSEQRTMAQACLRQQRAAHSPKK